MPSSKRINFFVFTILIVSVSVTLMLLPGCSREPAWKSANERAIIEHNIKERVRDDIPETGIISNFDTGVITNINDIPETEIAPGAKGRICWGKGALVNRMTLDPGAEIPKEILSCERIMMVMKGSVEQLINGAFVTMSAHEYERMTPVSGRRPKNEFVYLKKGAENAMKAGDNGAEIIEVYSPVRFDYMRKAGATKAPIFVPEDDYSVVPSIEPNRVYNYYDVQFTELFSGAHSRLISGKGVQLSFLRMDPGSVFNPGNHPEEQMRIVLRGRVDMAIIDETRRMQTSDILLLPSGMVHSSINGPLGCDVLDVFWPVRPDFTGSMNERLMEYHSVIPEDAVIELVADGAVEGPGLCYSEGPSWVNGKLYFSSMHYDESWNGDPGRSAFVEMDSDGAYRYKSFGEMETNGTFPLGNGNLAVCDMYGHRVVEMTTGGRVVRVLAGEYNGVRLDGPNDLAVDDKGGIYFTDPQILPEPHMQPGRSVFYITPGGKVIRVIEPDALTKANGLILSPDCRTLYVNSTPDNFIMAYDVNDDGTLSNARKFCDLFVTPEILDRQSVNPQVDGMTVDERGNIYITSIIGLQIFNPDGSFIGIIHFPLMPVNCCFGDEDAKTLYVTCNDKIYRIRTKVKGAAYTLKR